jgi:large subunit ribosomal protein L31e
MAKEKKETPEQIAKEFIIPLRKEWRKVANYKRAGRAAREIKRYVARHMKTPDHDTSMVKLDVYLNNEVWFRGKKKPHSKIKVKVLKEGDKIMVYLAETPDYVRFLKAKHEKRHKAPAKTDKPKTEEKKDETTHDLKEETAEEKEEKKKEEKEKSTSVAEQKADIAKTQAKQMQKATKIKEPRIHRLALKK